MTTPPEPPNTTPPSTEPPLPPDLGPVERLTRDLKKAATTLSPQEARYLVDAYYIIQEYRTTTANQVRALGKSDEPHEVITWLLRQHETLEAQVKRALDAWSDTQELGRWAKGITGIGPVISSGLLAHIDIEKCPTAGHIWSFAGYNPTVVWEKKQRRPWNARLKILCWKIGESFVKVSTNDSDIYGKVYVARKELEWQHNLAGDLATQAKLELERKDYSKKDTLTLKWYSGKFEPAAVRAALASPERDAMAKLPVSDHGTPMLPPAHIHARAKRYAVKLFLAHYWETGYRLHFGKEPPLPYPISHIPGHTHYIPAP
jgi:hypothetical protein